MSANTTKSKRKLTTTDNIATTNTQLADILKLCQEMKLGQDEIKQEQIKINQKIIELEQKLNTEVKENIKSYAECVSKNIEETSETKKAVSSMKQSVTNLENQFSSKMEQEQNTLLVINKDLEKVKSSINKTAENEYEEKVRLQKANNVVIFHVPEPNFDEELNYKHDVKAVHKLLSERVAIKKEEVLLVKRQGFNKEKTRPIVIRFSNQEIRKKVLALRNLTYEDSDQTHNIYITTDKTRKEQEEHKKLVATLKERKANGEEHLMIKNGKIVKIMPFRANPQNYWG